VGASDWWGGHVVWGMGQRVVLLLVHHGWVLVVLVLICGLLLLSVLHRMSRHHVGGMRHLPSSSIGQVGVLLLLLLLGVHVERKEDGVE
jgi:hypothetical protein